MLSLNEMDVNNLMRGPMASAQAPPLEQELTGRPPSGSDFYPLPAVSSSPMLRVTLSKFPSRVRRMNDEAVIELSLSHSHLSSPCVRSGDLGASRTKRLVLS